MKMSDEQKKMFDGLTPLQKACVLKRLENPLMKNSEIYKLVTGKTDITANNARVQGHLVFNRPKVLELLSSFNVAALDETIMGRDEMMFRLSKIARHELTDVIEVIHPEQKLMDTDTGEIIEGQSGWALKRDADMSLVTELTKSKDGLKVKTQSATDAMKQLAVMQGFNAAEKREISGPGGSPIQTKELSDEEFIEQMRSLGLLDD